MAGKVEITLGPDKFVVNDIEGGHEVYERMFRDWLGVKGGGGTQSQADELTAKINKSTDDLEKARDENKP